jgi:hypothetical protein
VLEVVEVLYRFTATKFAVRWSACAPVWNGGTCCGARKDELEEVRTRSMLFFPCLR